MTKTLDRIAAEQGTDKHQHGYCLHYERHFAHLQDAAINVLEVGTYYGASVRMWHEWFSQAHITGIDINPYGEYPESPRVRVVQGDVKTWAPEVEFHVIVDDGSHLPTDIILAFERLWPVLAPGGYYAIEDWHVQWDSDWQGDARTGSRAVGLVHELIDHVLREDFRRECDEVHVYPQLSILRKAAARD